MLLKKETQLFPKFPTSGQDMADVYIRAQELENTSGSTARTFNIHMVIFF